MNLLLIIFIIFFLNYNIKSGKIQPNFDEIFGEEWHKNEKGEKAIKIEQIEQNENSEFNNNVEENGGANGTHPNNQQKREIIRKFEQIKEKLKQKGKLQRKDQNKIECKIGKLLGTNRQKIYKWKKELNLNKKSYFDEKKKKFIERIDEFKSLYGQGKQKEFVKELGISNETFHKWKKELAPKYHKAKNNYSNKDKLKKMKQYFEIKELNLNLCDQKIAKKLGIGLQTLIRWKNNLHKIR